MLYFFIFLLTYVLYNSYIISCLGSFIFFFIIFTALLALGVLNLKMYSNSTIQSEITFMISLIIWLKLYNLTNLFECITFTLLFSNIININYNFLKKNFITKNNDLFFNKNKSNIYEEINVYKKIISNISCFH
jgi:hypothetical protein